MKKLNTESAHFSNPGESPRSTNLNLLPTQTQLESFPIDALNSLLERQIRLLSADLLDSDLKIPQNALLKIFTEFANIMLGNMVITNQHSSPLHLKQMRYSYAKQIMLLKNSLRKYIIYSDVQSSISQFQSSKKEEPSITT